MSYGRYRRPVDRVWAALNRLSRDKWLCPSEVFRLGMAMANCCGNNPSRTFHGAARYADLTGMLGGRCLAFPGEETYLEALALAEKHNDPNREGARAEIDILKLRAKQNEHNRRASQAFD